ncbi:MAG: XRE family transcriptional regulator [Hyphomicrobiales bacterium]|nr:XRE family transcriptional regulator [Hyphomicrobiales bacterium]
MRKRDTKKGTAGSSFEEFLKEEGEYEDATEHAVRHVLAFQLAKMMREQGISKMKMAKRMETSRSQLDRLLSPEGPDASLDALARAAKAVGQTLRVELV